ncbi:MAG: hypothetical protein RMJ98_09280 [Myxococcales bacterium]|nr:hypothetical protein [Polyangiaceae bacterium]MDW8249478.1 hypothetical protein [Myxococcales bacterium]
MTPSIALLRVLVGVPRIALCSWYSVTTFLSPTRASESSFARGSMQSSLAKIQKLASTLSSPAAPSTRYFLR